MPKNTSTTAFNWFAAANQAYTFGDPNGFIWYVNSASSQAADDANHGYSPETPFASIAYAITRATADNDDVIDCAATHVETVTGAAGVNINKAGLWVRGRGVGQKRTKVNFTTAVGASFDVAAAGVRVTNVWFNCAIDNQTAMVNVSAADAAFHGCEFMTADGSAQAALGLLTTAAAHRLVVVGCHFHGSNDAGTAAALRLAGGDDWRVADNVIVGAYTTTLGGIDNTAASLRVAIDGNVILNKTASSTVAINLHASTTGAVVNNRLGILSGAAPIVGAAVDTVGGNYYKNAVGVAAGTLI